MTHPGGRPLKFETPEILEQKINEYFVKCDEGEEINEPDKRGNLIKYISTIPYTFEELALWLDCETKTVRNYGTRDRFLPIITRARQRIYASWVKNGLKDRYNSKMTALCLAANNKDYNVAQVHEVTAMTYEDKLRLIEERKRIIAGPDVSQVIDDAEIIKDD